MVKFFLVIIALVLIAGGLWWGQNQQITPPPLTNLPWQTEVLALDKVKVFGVIIGESSLLALRQALDKSAEVALLETQAGLSLEVYFGTVKLNAVLSGKLIALPIAEEDVLKALLKESIQRQASASGWRYELSNATIAKVQAWPLRFLTLVPEADFSEERLLILLGEPEKRLPDPTNPEVSHWFYGARGVAVTVNAKGREIFSYFAPQDLPWVRSRLLEVPRTTSFLSPRKLVRLTVS